MPDITKDQYLASLRDNTCVTGHTSRPWWANFGFIWSDCKKCSAHHCRDHKLMGERWISEWTCLYCGHQNKMDVSG